MGIYSYLNYKSSHDSSDLENHVIDGIESKYDIPVAWLALFRSDQLESSNFIAVSLTTKAIETLNERSQNMQLAFGKEWQEGIENFMKPLTTSKYVEMNLQDWFEEPAVFESFMEANQLMFSKSYFTGEKHLFSRKMKINKLWEKFVSDRHIDSRVFE